MDGDVQRPPTADVLHAFDIDGPLPLPGGRGRAFACGDVVLKPTDDPDDAAFVAEVMVGVVEDGFRVERPVPASDGRIVVDGWTAWTRLDGVHAARWDQILAVCPMFNASIAAVRPPPMLDRRRSVWDVGNRVAWGEEDVDLDAAVAPLVERLTALRGPIDLPFQVIHGDLAGNVLFADGAPPAVIDFSPHHRPAGYSSAIAIVDAITWWDADPSIVAFADGVDELDQLLVRAAIFRLATSSVSIDDPARLRAEADAYERVVGWLAARMRG